MLGEEPDLLGDEPEVLCDAPEHSAPEPGLPAEKAGQPGGVSTRHRWDAYRLRMTPTDVGPKPPFVVPFLRNPGFVGREEDLDQVHLLLQKEEPVAVLPVAASGMGGIGKTQLAVEYAYRHAGDYRGASTGSTRSGTSRRRWRRSPRRWGSSRTTPPTRSGSGGGCWRS